MRYGPEARMADLGILLAAADADELHRALVLSVPACQEREPTLAVALFRSIHERAGDGAAVTAMLLMTDARWSAAARPVATRLEETGLVPGDELDLLARAFVAADDAVYWSCPADWFDGPEIVVTFDDDDIDGDEEEQPVDDREVVVARRVTTGLRRWAAARLVRSEPSTWGELLGLARSVGGARGGAVMLGLLDERTILTHPAARLIETAALQWSRRDVRAAASRRVTSMPRARPPAADDRATTAAVPVDGARRAAQPSLF